MCLYDKINMNGGLYKDKFRINCGLSVKTEVLLL